MKSIQKISVRVGPVTLKGSEATNALTFDLDATMVDRQGKPHRLVSRSTSRETWLKQDNRWLLKRSEVLTAEQTEDVQKIGAVAPLELSYFKTSFLQLVQKRVGWLIILFFGGFFTETALRHFSGVLLHQLIARGHTLASSGAGPEWADAVRTVLPGPREGASPDEGEQP